MYDVTRRRLEDMARPRPPERPGMHYVPRRTLAMRVERRERTGQLDHIETVTGRIALDSEIIDAVTTSVDLKASERIGMWSKCGFREMYLASLNY